MEENYGVEFYYYYYYVIIMSLLLLSLFWNLQVSL